MLLKARFEQARWLALITCFLVAIPCSAQSISGQQIAQRNSSERTYKKDPKWRYTFEDWCMDLRVEGSMTAAEEVTVTHLRTYIASKSGGFVSCAQLQDYLENELALVAVGNITNLSPYISLKDAKKLHVIALDGQGIRQREVDKLDFLNDYNPRFRRLTLPWLPGDEGGDYATCPLADPDKCRA